MLNTKEYYQSGTPLITEESEYENFKKTHDLIEEIKRAYMNDSIPFWSITNYDEEQIEKKLR